jgi:penicillin amidase
MDLMRRLARGETAEIFGRQTLEEDKRWRKFGFAKIAQDSLQYLSPELRLALDSYSKGVNAYISSLDDSSIPVEFRILQYRPRPWEPADTVVIGKILADALSTTWRNDLLRASILALPREKVTALTNQVTPYDVVLFGKDAITSKAVARTNAAQTDLSEVLAAAEREAEIRRGSLERVGMYAEELAASNNWVISGRRTASGLPILANDPHLQPTAPGIWYLTEIESPTMHAAGVTFPGVPGIVLGHNESIAWGATNVGPDVQDLYVETIDATGRAKTPTGSEAVTIRKEEIKYRPNPLKPDTSSETLDVVETRNGVVIMEEGTKRYALKWTARDPRNNEFEAFYFANRAKNWDEFTKALRSYGGATQNFVYADAKGNIGWYAAGKIPIRRTGDGSMPYDGGTSDGEWVGYIPFEDLPHVYNPPSGLIVTANQRIVGTDYKYSQVSRDAATPWRARRIYDLLKDRSRVTPDDVRDVQYDVYNIPLANLGKEIAAAPVSSETKTVINSWDGRMTAESSGALLVNEIRGCLANKIAADNSPVPANVIRERVLDTAVREKQAMWLPKGYDDYGSLIKACDTEVVDSLTKKYGPDRSKWTWGTLAVSRFPHPLAVVPLIGGQFSTPSVPISGSGQTPNVASAVSMRFVATPGRWDETRHVIPLGESGDPRSAHYKDQFDAWKNGTPMIFPFSPPAVEAATRSILFIDPQ